MMHGGNGDGGRVQFEIGSQKFVHGSEDGNRVLSRGLGGTGRVRLDGRDQGDANPGGIRSSRLQLAIDPEVVFAKGACSGNGNAQSGLTGYNPAPLSESSTAGAWPSTTLRQRL